MMLNLGVFIAMTAQAATIAPTGPAKSVKWAKNVAYEIDASRGLAFDVTGPVTLALDFYGTETLKGVAANITIICDATSQSQNVIRFRPKKAGPPNAPFAVRLGLPVPDGLHHYVIRAEGKEMMVRVTKVKNVPKAQLAAPGQAIAPPAVAAAAPAPTVTPPPGPPPPAAPPEKLPAGAAPAAASPAQPTIPSSPQPTVPPSPQPAGAGDAGVASTETVESLMHSAVQMSVGDAEPPRVTPAPAPNQALRLAVYDLEAKSIEPHVARVVTDSLLAEVRKLKNVSAIGMAEIRDMLSLEAARQATGCAENESCLAEIGGALGVDELVTGVVAQLGDGSVLTLRRVDQRMAKVRSTTNKRLKAGAGEEFLLAIGPSVEELYPDRELRPGAQRGVQKEVVLRLDPPPLPRWSFFATAGGAAAAAGIGGVFGLLANAKKSQYDTLAAQSVASVVSGRELTNIGNAAQSRASLANYSFIGAGALALSAAVMAFFTDWAGLGDER